MLYDMKPSLYLYKESNKGFELYVNEISTIYGLKALYNSQKIKLTSIGATLYKNLGFLTEKDVPEFQQVHELIEFLNINDDIGLINFEVEIINKGKMSSHDDGECHFTLKKKQDVIDILNNITPQNQTNLIIESLFSNNGIYIAIDNNNTIQKFATFDQYLNK